MPTLMDFGRCRLRRIADDHKPPHFHLVPADWQATFTVLGSRHMKGADRPAAAKATLAWARENESLPLAKGSELNERDDERES